MKIPIKYLDFSNIFLEEKAFMSLEQTNFNKHTIKLEDSKQSFHRPIYSVGPVKLETLKTYIQTYVKTEFI